MRMKKIFSIVLVMVLLASAVPLAVTPAGAQQAGIPFAGEDNELTKEELVNAILPYMLDEGDLKLDNVGDASWVYAYWGGAPKTVVDDDKQENTLYRPLERVVIAYAHPYTILQSIKATDKVVAGLTYNLMLYPDFVDLPSIGTAWNINYEALMMHQPELVFIRVSGQGTEHEYGKIKDLNPNIAVVRFHCYKSWNVTDYVEDTRQLGYLFDREEEAEEFIDYYEGFFDVIAEKVSDIPEEDKLRVYYAGSSTFGRYKKTNSEMIIAAGGNDIFGGVKGSQVSSEDVIKLDPEVIFKSARGGGYEIDDITTFKNVRDEIMNRDELQNVTAVKTGRVYVISTTLDCCGAAGGRYFVGIPYIAKALYPALDLDPKALHQEFITRFQGMDYDTDKHGVFFYHPEQFPEGR